MKTLIAAATALPPLPALAHPGHDASLLGHQLLHGGAPLLAAAACTVVALAALHHRRRG